MARKLTTHLGNICWSVAIAAVAIAAVAVSPQQARANDYDDCMTACQAAGYTWGQCNEWCLNANFWPFLQDELQYGNTFATGVSEFQTADGTTGWHFCAIQSTSSCGSGDCPFWGKCHYESLIRKCTCAPTW
ncbi:MAG: hypothetical protein ACJ8C4_07220 [Gemmataceae bacterium]